MRKVSVIAGSVILCLAVVFLMGATKKNMIHYGSEVEIQLVQGEPNLYQCKLVIRDLDTDTVLSAPTIRCKRGHRGQLEVKDKDTKDGVFAHVLVSDDGMEISYSVKFVQEDRVVFAQSAKISL